MRYGERRVFQHDSIRMAYFTAGSGHPIIFIHNGGSDHRVWDYQTEYFARTHSVYAVDLPGYGESDRPDTEFSLSFYVNYIEHFIDRLGVSSPVIVGNCVGSAIAVEYALRHPTLVRGLVLCNVLTERTLRAGIFGILYRLIRNRGVVHDCLSRLARFRMVGRISGLLASHIQYGPRGDSDPLYRFYIRRRYADSGQIRVLYSLLANIAGFSKLDEVVRPDGYPPTTILWGERNRVLPAPSGVHIRERLAPGRSTIVSGCGHLLMREDYQMVNDWIEAFVRELG